MVKRVYNFYAGPATLPLPVLEKAQKDLLNFDGTGMSLMEISHRSKEYAKMHTEASSLVRELMGIPDDYKIMWLQGRCVTTDGAYGVISDALFPVKPVVVTVYGVTLILITR